MKHREIGNRGITRRAFIKRGMAAMSTLAVGETILLSPNDAEAFFWNQNRPIGQRKAVMRPNGKGKIKNDYRRAKIIKGVCLNCSTVCGIQGYVIDGKLVKVGGNPEDPNNGKMLCAKGQSGPTINTYADRLLYPLRRVGKRGEGKWKRITWDEAYDEMARRIKKAMDEGVPEEVAIHIGRSRIPEEMGRFLNAIGSPSLFNHRALCSSNKRAANYASLGETDWET
ncbi:MAG TPA: molybdopterin-dependent oxidoreductase, partial [Burkholderiales bacterium]|nr:molybdopterin-dependent oxidoreductase [Burkholderiales bacterium]